MAFRDYTNTPSSNSSVTNGSANTTASQAIAINLPKGLKDLSKTTYRKVMFRDQELFNLITVLNRLDKPNALITAQPGSGKSAIVRELVERIDKKDPMLPTNLLNSHIYELSLSELNADNSFVGQTEKAINDVIDFATDPANHAIIFVDEFHQLFDDNSSQISKLSQALKPAMARDNFRLIGATTTGESKTILKDPAFNRRMEQVRLHTLTVFETSEILKNVLPRYEKHHHVVIKQDLIPDIVKLADMHYTKSARPDNALTLIDQASSLTAMTYNQLASKLAGTQVSVPTGTDEVTRDILETTINNHTGNAAMAAPKNLTKKLKSRVKGQDESIEDMAKQITLFRANLVPTKTPFSMLLAGPTGNGKTETARALTQLLYNDDSRMTVINMTEYQEANAINQLIGSPDGYVGSDSKRDTPFDAVFENPTQILLLDEFEKAHKEIQQLFYQILEEGFIEDRRGRRIDFSKSILIFTSNAETKKAVAGIGFATNNDTSVSKRSELIASLSDYIPDALLNRMTKIYAYNAISKEQYKEIIRLKFNKLVDDMLDNNPDLNVSHDTLTDEILDKWVDETYNPKLNGRPAKHLVQSKLSEAAFTALDNNSNDIILN